MELEFINYEKREHIAYITFNRPQVMNAFHPPLFAELQDIWNDYGADRNLWVAIVTGAGPRAFSAGFNLKYAAEHRAEMEGEKDPVLNPGTPFDLYKPVIAAVNGVAMGGGFEMVMACDIVVAAEHARFALSEPRVGLAAAAGGVHRLPRQVPLKLAMGLMLTGKTIDAQEAFRYGLINEIVPPGELMPAAERWAREILDCSPVAVQTTKELALEGLGFSLKEALARDYPGLARMKASKDMKEGPLAFAQRRKPVWSNE